MCSRGRTCRGMRTPERGDSRRADGVTWAREQTVGGPGRGSGRGLNAAASGFRGQTTLFSVNSARQQALMQRETPVALGGHANKHRPESVTETEVPPGTARERLGRRQRSLRRDPEALATKPTADILGSSQFKVSAVPVTLLRVRKGDWQIRRKIYPSMHPSVCISVCIHTHIHFCPEFGPEHVENSSHPLLTR